ncbi:phosphoribosylglycinamide formyltransferase [Oceanithermus sp.]|uniref:phosphoribosylglycinamide formyltransferase n=1 Tax=Oceanithermus sp. TaxID=2268145 RepID=UPI00257E9D75|nr:phosphoribosylglycinamide formyltransferase [Oceanithermus sp.]
MAEPARLVVLASGRGTNLQALLDTCAAGGLAARVVLVVSDQPSRALERARGAGVPALFFPREKGVLREAYDRRLAAFVAAAEPDLVVLAGWMRILTPAFLDRFPGRVINLHPALPGAFPGLNAIRRSYEAFRRGEVKSGGVMVHHVVPEVDAGPVIVSEPVPVEPDDTLERFEARVHAVEHRLLVEAVRRVLGAR